MKYQEVLGMIKRADQQLLADENRVNGTRALRYYPHIPSTIPDSAFNGAPFPSWNDKTYLTHLAEENKAHAAQWASNAFWDHLFGGLKKDRPYRYGWGKTKEQLANQAKEAVQRFNRDPEGEFRRRILSAPEKIRIMR